MCPIIQFDEPKMERIDSFSKYKGLSVLSDSAGPTGQPCHLEPNVVERDWKRDTISVRPCRLLIKTFPEGAQVKEKKTQTDKKRASRKKNKSPPRTPQPPPPAADASTRAARSKANTERRSKYAQIAHLHQSQTQTRWPATASPSRKLTAGSRGGVKRCSGSPSLGRPCSSPTAPKDKGSRRATGRHLSPRGQLLETSHCQKISPTPQPLLPPPPTTSPSLSSSSLRISFLSTLDPSAPALCAAPRELCCRSDSH